MPARRARRLRDVAQRSSRSQLTFPFALSALRLRCAKLTMTGLPTDAEPKCHKELKATVHPSTPSGARAERVEAPYAQDERINGAVEGLDTNGIRTAASISA
jgi:hypothetical protein